MRRGLDPVLVAAYGAQATRVADWLTGLSVADLDAPSRLPGWRVADLAAHLVVSGAALAVAAPAARGVKALTVGAYLAAFTAAEPAVALPTTVAVDTLGPTAAPGPGHAAPQPQPQPQTRPQPGQPPAALVGAFAASVDAVQQVLAGLADADPVLSTDTGPVRASDLLRTRVLELVVHTLDVPAGAGGLPALGRDRQAVRVCCRLLVAVLAERHPGQTIEVRVPPYAAVQIGGLHGPGPTHTRGTPPNVVECGPEVFLAVATGRRPWAAAVEAGEVRESGARADLAPYLPLV
jgi:uncharacterized protein (TIGR03083 family)